jgi:hypothetical protein
MAKVKLGKFEVDEEELDRQHEEATRRGRETLARLPKADSARYDRKTKRLVLNLKNGTTLLVPVQLIQGLQTDDEELLNDFQLVIEGSQIHWDKLDVQFYVKSLLDGVFGTKKWMESLQKRENKSTSKTRRPQKNAA